jgi:phosphoglycolate phosphatase
MKNRFDLIIFDWDGTLMDSIDWIVGCLQQAAMDCRCPVPTTQAAKDIIGLSIEQAMDALFPDSTSSMREQLINCYGQHFFSRQIGPEDIFVGVSTMLEQMKRSGYKLAVATGKKDAGLKKAMVATGLMSCFDITRSADQSASKPHPLMIEQILKALDVSKPRAVMVGDSIHDMQMAQNAGVSAIAVACGAHAGEVLQQFNPLLCLQQTSELADIF